MKIAIVDKLGLCYDGNTLSKQGLGGSESAVILIAKNLQKIGFEVTVFNNCKDGSAAEPGIYDGVKYIDNSHAKDNNEQYDIVIVSRSVMPFVNNEYPFISQAKKRVLWLHDTFIEGDQIVEDLVINKKIDHIFTLSDWHTSYILNCNHGKRRNYEVLKKSIFQTRNGAVQHIQEIDLSKKDKNHFVYNASATKGMVPLVELIWPKIKQQIPAAKLTVIGGYYRFREGAKPDEQENTVEQLSKRQDLKDLGVTFTGVITQQEIAEILANAYMMLYPGAFPETFGISTVESLLYNTPLVTTEFGALEEVAVDRACYKINYAIEPNGLFPSINKEQQVEKFVHTVINAYKNAYLHQQKQNYCNVIKDVAGWDSVALQWKQFFYRITGNFLSVSEYRQVTRINNKVSRIFGRTSSMPNNNEYKSYGTQRRIVVISPFWNAEQYVEQNILSVAQQDYDNYLHILIDDNSDDNSYNIAEQTISNLPIELQQKFKLLKNDQNNGAILNQIKAIEQYVDNNDIVILLDGDDWLVNNNTIFHYYNDLYDQGYEFTYGSMWSVVDNIPLISQDYPSDVKKNKTYRKHLFNWKIPYTHLRTVLGEHIKDLDVSKFKDEAGNWMKAGHDNPLFYELIEKVDADKIYCNKEIVCNYNDANPLNDYKIKRDEQTKNANLSYKGKNNLTKRILVAIPTAKYIESDTFKSIFDLDVPEGYKLDFQYFYGYQIDQIRNLIAEWAKHYDYLFSVDSDIVLPNNALRKMLQADKDIISGMYIQRKTKVQTLEVYMRTDRGVVNIPYSLLENLELAEIEACGMGCALIKSDVFRKMEYPHYYYKSAIDHSKTISEDVYFCLKAKSLGFSVWVDATIKCDHIGITKFSLETEAEKNIESVFLKDLLPKDHVSYIENLDVNPKVIYDIGSCVLHWQRHAKRIWPSSKIYMFEANKDVKKLYDKLGLNYHLGVLSDQDNKTVKFYKDPMNLGGNSYYKENTVNYNETHAITEITKTLDSIVAENKWPFPDLIKIDVQGAEIDILKGAEQCLINCNDIILEAQHVEYNAGAPNVDSVIEFMNSIGFELINKFSIGKVDGDYHFRKIR